MKQIKESELKEIIKSMNGKTVKIDIKGIITTSIVLQEVVSHYSISYNYYTQTKQICQILSVNSLKI